MNTASTRRVIARNVERLRKAQDPPKGWSQQYLARRAGVSQRTISNIETLADPDKTDYSPTLEALQKIAAVFGLEAWHLMLPLPDELLQSKQVEKLVECFLTVGKEGREAITRIAENEVRYSRHTPKQGSQDQPVKRR